MYRKTKHVTWASRRRKSWIEERDWRMDLEREKNSICKKVEDREYWMCLMQLESLGKLCGGSQRGRPGPGHVGPGMLFTGVWTSLWMQFIFHEALCSMPFQKVTMVAFWKLEREKSEIGDEERIDQLIIIITTIQLRQNAHLDQGYARGDWGKEMENHISDSNLWPTK